MIQQAQELSGFILGTLIRFSSEKCWRTKWWGILLLSNLDDQGNPLTIREQLEMDGLEYFTNLFQCRHCHCLNDPIQMQWFSKLFTNEINMWMSRRPLESEVRKVLTSSKLDKAPCLDRFTMGFFQCKWLIIMEDVMGMIIDFF